MNFPIWFTRWLSTGWLHDLRQKLTIGKLGIGTSKPAYLLQVAGTATSEVGFGDGSGTKAAGIIYLFNTAGAVGAQVYSAGTSYFNGGSLTVGTTSTAYKFEVHQSANTYAGLFRNTAGSGIQNGLLVWAGSNSSDNSFVVNNATNTLTYFQVRGDGEVIIPGVINMSETKSANFYTKSGSVSSTVAQNIDFTVTFNASSTGFQQPIMVEIDIYSVFTSNTSGANRRYERALLLYSYDVNTQETFNSYVSASDVVGSPGTFTYTKNASSLDGSGTETVTFRIAVSAGANTIYRIVVNTQGANPRIS